MALGEIVNYRKIDHHKIISRSTTAMIDLKANQDCGIPKSQTANEIIKKSTETQHFGRWPLLLVSPENYDDCVYFTYSIGLKNQLVKFKMVFFMF